MCQKINDSNLLRDISIQMVMVGPKIHLNYSSIMQMANFGLKYTMFSYIYFGMYVDNMYILYLNLFTPIFILITTNTIYLQLHHGHFAQLSYPKFWLTNFFSVFPWDRKFQAEILPKPVVISELRLVQISATALISILKS